MKRGLSLLAFCNTLTLHDPANRPPFHPMLGVKQEGRQATCNGQFTGQTGQRPLLPLSTAQSQSSCNADLGKTWSGSCTAAFFSKRNASLTSKSAVVMQRSTKLIADLSAETGFPREAAVFGIALHITWMRDTSKLALSRASHWKERFMEGGRYLSVN